MSATLTVSIVTPSFNQAEYLEECIESVLGQGYPNLEYVIMDGGSTDGSVEIIKKFEKYLTYWQSCPDGGQYLAITDGFRRTTGQIMAWLNSDDKLHPLAIAKVASVLTDHPEVSWLTGRKSFWDASGNLSFVEDSLPIFSRRKVLEGHFNKPYVQQESTFWRRSLWEQAGACLDNDMKLAGDMGLWCRFFRFAPLYVVDTLLGGYRFHEGQRGVTHAAEYVEECRFVLERERQEYTGTIDALPDPPAILGLTRDQLGCFLAEAAMQPRHPNRTTSWCEYTEDLISTTSLLVKERRVDQSPFWQNEIALFSLAKPRCAWLLADSLGQLESEWHRLKELLDDGARLEKEGQEGVALECYREARSLAPRSASAGERLVRCLWALGERAEALRTLAELLEHHAHNEGVVRAAIEVLIGCGASGQARGVCDEYLTVNPHAREIRALRSSMENC